MFNDYVLHLTSRDNACCLARRNQHNYCHEPNHTFDNDFFRIYIDFMISSPPIYGFSHNTSREILDQTRLLESEFKNFRTSKTRQLAKFIQTVVFVINVLFMLSIFSLSAISGAGVLISLLATSFFLLVLLLTALALGPTVFNDLAEFAMSCHSVDLFCWKSMINLSGGAGKLSATILFSDHQFLKIIINDYITKIGFNLYHQETAKVLLADGGCLTLEQLVKISVALR